jgi:hypothetical protein
MTNIFSDIPIWAIAVWGLFAFALSWFYYRKKSWLKEVNLIMRRVMFLMRGIGLTLLGILLANILIQSTKLDKNNPYLIRIVDNSLSMKNYKDSTQVDAEVKAFIRSLNGSFDESYNSLTFNLDKGIKDVDSLNFNNEYSNFSSVLNTIYDDYYGRNIGAVVFVSDGNYNQGVRPTFAVEKFKNIPFFTIGVGDTVQKTDQRIQNVVANDIAFLDNTFPIEASIEGMKLPSKEYTVALLEDGKKIHEEKYKHTDDQISLTKVKFLVSAKSAGIHEYTIQLSEQEDEYNLENNIKRIYLEVLDDRSKILMLAEGLHPDLGAIKMALAEEQNLEIDVITTKNFDEVKELDSYDLIVWHNPGSDGKNAIFERVVRADKPIWYIVGPKTSQQTLNQLDLAPTVQTTGQKDNVGIAYNTRFNLFELNRNTISVINEFPPLSAHYGKIKYPKNASILGYQKVGSIAKPEPVFFFGEKQEKYAVTYGNGLWNWRLGSFQQGQSHEAFNELIQKTVQYLIIKENKSRLRISIPKEISTAENTVIDARFYNESYEPITEPTINFTLTKRDGTSFDYAFLALDDFYKLDLGKLDYGRYTWKANVSFNGKSFDKSGNFVVEEVALEAQSTRADHQLLNQMALNQDGAFYTLDNASRVIEVIKNRKDITPVAYEQSTYKKLIDNLWWFVLLILIFGGEWVLRRYNGGY